MHINRITRRMVKTPLRLVILKATGLIKWNQSKHKHGNQILKQELADNVPDWSHGFIGMINILWLSRALHSK